MNLLVVFVVALIAGCHGATLDSASMTNSSALFGAVATFTCTVEGTQGAFETLIFGKVNADGTTTQLSSDATTVNTTKHTITGKYTLNINDAVYTDEGEYTCALGSIGANTAYLTVGVAPTEGWLYWGDNSTWTKKDVKANLTCEAGTARPPATFRWLRGTAEITTGIINPTSSVDAQGYGTAMSMLELTPTSADEGIEYTCHIDATGKDAVFSKKLAVSFSGAGSALASASLIVAALFMSLRM